MRKGTVVSGKDISGKTFSLGIVVDKAPFSVDVVKVKDYQKFLSGDKSVVRTCYPFHTCLREASPGEIAQKLRKLTCASQSAINDLLESPGERLLAFCELYRRKSFLKRLGFFWERQIKNTRWSMVSVSIFLGLVCGWLLDTTEELFFRSVAIPDVKIVQVTEIKEVEINPFEDAPSGWPLATEAKINSGFGIRGKSMGGNACIHKGVDIAVPVGTPVLATGDGRVIFVGWMGGYGNMVMVEHKGGYITRYGHLDKTKKVKVNQRVKKGMVIALSGNTGHSTGAHLHYEVLPDPQIFIELGKKGIVAAKEAFKK